MKNYTTESLINISKNAIDQLNKLDEERVQIEKTHLEKLKIETSFSSDKYSYSGHAIDHEYNVNRKAWALYFKENNFLSNSQKDHLIRSLNYDSYIARPRVIFWESESLINEIENNREKYLNESLMEVIDQLKIKYSVKTGRKMEEKLDSIPKILKTSSLYTIKEKTLSIYPVFGNYLLDNLEKVLSWVFNKEYNHNCLIGTRIYESWNSEFTDFRDIETTEFSCDFFEVKTYKNGNFKIIFRDKTLNFLNAKGTNKKEKLASMTNHDKEENPAFDHESEIQINLSIEGGLTVKGNTKTHREIFKNHSLYWYGPECIWYVRGSRGKVLTNSLFVTAYELIKELSSSGVTVFCDIEGKRVFPPQKLANKNPAKNENILYLPASKPKAIFQPAIDTPDKKAIVQKEEPKARKILEENKPVNIMDLHQYKSPIDEFKILIRSNLKKKFHLIRSCTISKKNICQVNFHDKSMVSLVVHFNLCSYNFYIGKNKTSTVMNKNPEELYRELEKDIASYIKDNYQTVKIVNDKMWAEFKIDSFYIADKADTINEPRTIDFRESKKDLVKAFNWANENKMALEKLDYKYFTKSLKDQTGIIGHSYCAMD